MAAPNAKSKFEREEHLARVAKYRLQGWATRRIATEMGISHVAVARDVKIVEARWLESQKADMGQIKARIADEIANLKSEFWGAWERSSKPAETKQMKKTGEKEEKSIRETSSVGDPRFLEGIRHCIEDEIELYGLNKLDEDMGDAAQAFAAKVRADLRAAEAMTLGDDDATVDKDS